MFDKVKRLERQIAGFEKEINDHRRQYQKTRDTVHRLRLEGATKRLVELKAKLIIVKAEQSRNVKTIQSEIDKLQKQRTELSRRWVQSADADVKRKLDGEIQSLDKKIDKLHKKLK